MSHSFRYSSVAHLIFHDFPNAQAPAHSPFSRLILFRAGLQFHMCSGRQVSLSIFEEVYGHVTIEQGSRLDMRLDENVGGPTDFFWVSQNG